MRYILSEKQKEEARERSRRWYQENKTRAKETRKKYRNAHKEKLNLATKLWKIAHPEKKKQYRAKRYQLHKDDVSREVREHREKFPEQSRNRLRNWRKNNPDRFHQQKANRRALEVGSDGTITAQEWSEIKEYYEYTCLCCNNREPGIKLTLDHVIPLSKGGKNTIDNAQPLCGSCNSRKGIKETDYR